MKDENIKKVLLLGSGALKIGEAGEFDNKVSLFVRFIDIETGKYETKIVNKNV